VTRIHASRQVETGSVGGTMGWMAPEEVRVYIFHLGCAGDSQRVPTRVTSVVRGCLLCNVRMSAVGAHGRLVRQIVWDSGEGGDGGSARVSPSASPSVRREAFRARLSGDISRGR
jgi:hypothetical protein